MIGGKHQRLIAPNYRNYIADGDGESNRPEIAFDHTILDQIEGEGENQIAPNISDEDIKQQSEDVFVNWQPNVPSHTSNDATESYI